MKNTFTQDQIIKYIYKEVSTSEKLRLEEAIDLNFEVRELYEATLKAITALPKVEFNPKTEAINKILGYSQSTQLEPLH